jgi:phosphoenolpyruvate carboxylase
MRSDRPQPGGIGVPVPAEGGQFDGDQVLSLLRGVTIYPVFTAHPTESTWRTLRKQQQIAT